MPKLRIVTSLHMCKLVEKYGFIMSRQKDSHRFFRHPDGRTTVVPIHSRDLSRGLTRKILADIEMSVSEFEVALDKI